MEFITNNPISVALIGAAVIAYIWYMQIIGARNKAQEAFSGIDVQLKKRTDLIPNILAIAKKFMEHEKELLEEVTRLRTEVMKSAKSNNSENTAGRLQLESLLSDKMSGLMIAVENYPDLKSQQNMIEAQRAYMDVEAHISAARRSYNAAVNSLKNKIQIFPGNIIARLAGVSEMPFFEASEADKAAVDASKLL